MPWLVYAVSGSEQISHRTCIFVQLPRNVLHVGSASRLLSSSLACGVATNDHQTSLHHSHSQGSSELSSALPPGFVWGCENCSKTGVLGGAKTVSQQALPGGAKTVARQGPWAIGWQGGGLEKKLGGSKKVRSENGHRGALPNPSVDIKLYIWSFSDHRFVVNFRPLFF